MLGLGQGGLGACQVPVLRCPRERKDIWVETCVVRLFVGEGGGVELDLRGQVELVKDGRVERFSSKEELLTILFEISASSGAPDQTAPG